MLAFLMTAAASALQSGKYTERHIVPTCGLVQPSHMTNPQGPGTAPGAGPLIRLMTVDDHPIYRGGLASLIGAYRDFQLIAEAANGREAVEKYREHRPDVTLMDLSMPIMGGVEAIKTITAEFPDARIIALTTWDGDADIHKALEAGARGYLLKDVVSEDVASSIRRVHAGGRSIPTDVANRLAAFTPRIDLTDREVEVLTYMARGLSNMEFGGLLGWTEGTIKLNVLLIL
jgi:DNA-binding NarL/FixJ family response regulator